MSHPRPPGGVTPAPSPSPSRAPVTPATRWRHTCSCCVHMLSTPTGRHRAGPCTLPPRPAPIACPLHWTLCCPDLPALHSPLLPALHCPLLLALHCPCGCPALPPATPPTCMCCAGHLSRKSLLRASTYFWLATQGVWERWLPPWGGSRRCVQAVEGLSSIRRGSRRGASRGQRGTSARRARDVTIEAEMCQPRGWHRASCSWGPCL